MASSFPRFWGPGENCHQLWISDSIDCFSSNPDHFWVRKPACGVYAGPQFFPSAMLENFGKKNGWNQQRKPEKKKDTQDFTEQSHLQKKNNTLSNRPVDPFHGNVTIQGIKAHTHNSFIELLPKNTVALAAGSQIFDTWWDTDLPYPVQSTRNQYSMCFFFQACYWQLFPSKITHLLATNGVWHIMTFDAQRGTGTQVASE